MRYPKRGEAVYVVGQLYSHYATYTCFEERTPAVIVAGGVDAAGRTHVMVPMLGEFWANAYQIIYPDTNLCGDGLPRWPRGPIEENRGDEGG